MLRNILFPGFLKRIDNRLLYHNPLLWSSRLHYVAWLVLLAWVLLAGVGLLIPVFNMDMDFLGFYWMMAVLVFITGMILWLIYLLRHNNTKQFGDRSPGREWSNMLYQYLCMALISSIMFAVPAGMMVKAHFYIQKDSIVEKVNILNINGGFFPSNNYDYQTFYAPEDTFQNGQPSGFNASPNLMVDVDNYHKLNPAVLQYDTISTIFNSIILNGNIRQGVTEFIATVHSLGYTYAYSVDDVMKHFGKDGAYIPDNEFENYNDNLKWNFSKEKMDRYFDVFRYFDFLLEGMFYYVWLLIMIPIALVFLIVFRNMSLRSFLISSGVTLALVIVNAIVMGILMDDVPEQDAIPVVMSFFIAWGMVLFFFSMRTGSAKYYDAVGAYSVYLFNLLLPVLPVILSALFIQLKIKEHVIVYGYEQDYWLRESFSDIMYTVHVASLIFFVLIQQWYFKPRYERLWALPKK